MDRYRYAFDDAAFRMRHSHTHTHTRVYKHTLGRCFGWHRLHEIASTFFSLQKGLANLNGTMAKDKFNENRMMKCWYGNGSMNLYRLWRWQPWGRYSATQWLSDFMVDYDFHAASALWNIYMEIFDFFQSSPGNAFSRSSELGHKSLFRLLTDHFDLERSARAVGLQFPGCKCKAVCMNDARAVDLQFVDCFSHR